MKNTLIIIMLLILLTCPMTSFAAEKNDNPLDHALLIGDSFTAKLEGQEFEEKYNLSIVAYPGFTSMDLREVDYPETQPSKVIVLCGINDLIEKRGKVSVDEEAALLNELLEKYNVPIYVQLLFPVTELMTIAKPGLSNEKIEEYNKLLTELCYQNGYFVIDTRDNFIGEDGFLRNTEDGLHIEDQEQYIENITNAVNNQEEEIRRVINR